MGCFQAGIQPPWTRRNLTGAPASTGGAASFAWHSALLVFTPLMEHRVIPNVQMDACVCVCVSVCAVGACNERKDELCTVRRATARRNKSGQPTVFSPLFPCFSDPNLCRVAMPPCLSKSPPSPLSALMSNTV